MNPLRLYIENFYCHEKSFIDFTQFNSALIIAKINGNEDYSNGAGKTSIFKALEYVLFNETSSKLDTIIRDDTDYCKVTFDFELNSSIYRVCRTKTKKNNDLTFFQKLNNDLSGIHIIDDLGYHTASNALDQKEIWKNLTSTRSGDTEKELFKIIKTNYKFFANTSHFKQNDISGLATTSPEKRRQILKESLDLSIYSNLEKTAKNKYNSILKDLEKCTILIDNIGEVDNKIIDVNNNLKINSDNIKKIEKQIVPILDEEKKLNDNLSEKKQKLTLLKNNVENLLVTKKTLTSEINDLNNKNNEFKLKLNSLKSDAEKYISEISSLTQLKNKTASIDDSSKILEFENELQILNQKLSDKNAILSSNINKYEELKIPMPNEDICKHCRQEMSFEHKEQCKKSINEEIEKCSNIINSEKKQIKNLKEEIDKVKLTISNLKSISQKIAEYDKSIEQKNVLIESKRNLYKEYKSIIKNNDNVLVDKKTKLNDINLNLDQSILSEISNIELDIKNFSNKIKEVENQKNECLKKKSHYENAIIILNHQLSDLNNNKEKLKQLYENKSKLEKDLEYYPIVIQSFSNKGIPSLIIQNLLDELQNEANILLNQLKPGLQLQFVLTKENSDDDTLDITYYINNRTRYYQQLSGAMQICVMFSLKLGWAYVLKNKFGFNTSILLLDELDQCLDKAGVNSFVDIIKHFQHQFKILVITHNDRLKGKIENVICVSQDKDKISKAKLVSV